MRLDLVSLAKKVHELYAPRCLCKLNGEEPWRDVVKCARNTLLRQGVVRLDEFSKFGYKNVAVAAEVKCDPSITSRLHSGGAELQLGLFKLFDLVQSLEKAFDMLNGAEAKKFVKPIDYCPTTAVTENLRDQAAVAVYSNVRSILLSRPAGERRPLPDGIEGMVSDLGDPGYGVTVIQVEPTDELKRLKRQLHEIKHVEERLEAKILRLEREKKSKEKRTPPRARFS